MVSRRNSQTHASRATYCLVGKHDDVALTFCYLIYRTLPCLQIDVWKSLQTARLPLMSSKAGFMQPPGKLAVAFFNQHSNNLALGRGAWEMMRFPGLTLGDDGGKKNPPVGPGGITRLDRI